MSNIVIYVDTTNVSASGLIDLHRATGLPLSEVRRVIASGKPVIEQEIFDANYDDHAALIRSVLRAIESGGMEYRIYELPEGETTESCTFVDRCLVSIETVRNILSEADTEMDRQLDA
ncbi:hypothetical protein [Aeoliella sp.]|uniref:hypothetical protein n=1 Tax=Aeoliella sp. TaxID=2795800 RepID=UPI003CCC3710